MFVAKKMPRSLSAESYKSLRTNIRFFSVDKPVKTIVVTSSIPSEGKSTVAGNLAFSLSQDGARVLIIDCDLRKPSMHHKFFISNTDGLSDVLVNTCDIKKAIKKIDNFLFIITAGTIPPNPAEMLGSRSMDALIEELSINFDYIIIDTPPVLSVTDASILATKMDGVIIVVNAKKTRDKMIKQTYEKLTRVNAHIMGTVLNNCEKTKYNKYYGYYNEKQSKKLKKKK